MLEMYGITLAVFLLIGRTSALTMNVAGVLKERDEQRVVVDFNHPLAGQPVRFEVKIIGIL